MSAGEEGAAGARDGDGEGERAWAFAALASLGDGVIVADERARLVYHNAAAEELVGVRELESDPTRWPESYGIFRSDETTLLPADEQPLLRALRGEATRDVELFVRNVATPQGVHLLCSAAPVRDATGRVRGAACIFRDITARRRAESRLREGEWQKKAILDNIPDIAWLKDREGRFLVVNQRFVEAAGKRSADELVGKTDYDVWPRELADRYRGDDEFVMRTGLHRRTEEPLVTGAGRELWIETVKTRIVGDDGAPIGTTGISRDITERKRAEEVLRDTKDELERHVLERTAELARAQEHLVRAERLAVLGQLAGGVAHQIRNPLAAIMNATYVLKRHLGARVHPDVDDAIGIIHDEVRHANVIITGLLDYARVRTPDRHPTAIVDLVDRVLAADWLPDTVHVERAIPPEIPLLDVDADQLHGAIFNVVRNAVEAMPDGGTLRVELRVDADESQVVIAIQDTGAGISPQVASHLFEPLHSTKPMGIGLGLVTARTFVEAHGGRIRAVPVPRGARFEICLPLA